MRSLMRDLRVLFPRRAVAGGGPRDPAPTLWSYRYQRIMLTPLYRRALRVGLPAGAALLVAGLWLADAGNRALLGEGVERLLDGVREREAFMVRSLEVAGADPVLTEAVLGVLAVDLPVSSFDLDLPGLRDRVRDLSAVRDASLRLRPGGVLEVDVEARVPVAVWRYVDGLRLIDAEGAMTGMILDRADRSDLPLIAGDGAKEAIDEALALFAASAPIAPEVRGLVRMGERRWDLVLEGDVRVLLPAEGAVAALERVVALHQAQELLDRDVVVVDLRLPDRPTLRLDRPALNVLRAGADPATAPDAPIPEE